MRLRLLLATSVAAVAILTSVGHASAGGGGGCGDEGPFTPVASTQVAMEHACFEPGVVALAPGETLRIHNKDQMLHNVYGPGWFHGDVPPGETVSRTFDEVGTYTFACTLHPGMTGAVVVSDLEPIAATSPTSDGDDRSSGLVGAIGLASVGGLVGGWMLRAHRSTR